MCIFIHHDVQLVIDLSAMQVRTRLLFIKSLPPLVTMPRRLGHQWRVGLQHEDSWFITHNSLSGRRRLYLYNPLCRTMSWLGRQTTINIYTSHS